MNKTGNVNQANPQAPSFDADELVRDDGYVHGSVYTDDAIFAAEIERIFEHTWIWVGHDSEIPEPGDYKTTFVGHQPVIVIRGADDGVVRVVINRCRHRAATVCQDAYGNANFLRCAYHGWTYKTDGRLIGVPFPDRFGSDFDKSNLGLVRLARTETYRGFIFASLSPDVPDLEEHIGMARPYIDSVVDASPEGIELTAGCHRLIMEGNWKLQLENTIDPYHFSFLHESFLRLQSDRSKTKADFVNDVLRNVEWTGVDLGNGHAAHVHGRTPTIGKDDITDSPTSFTIFPSLGFVGFQARSIRPLSPTRTEVNLFPIMLKGVDPEVNAQRLRAHEAFYGPAGFGGPDDGEVAFTRVHGGLDASAGDPWVNISRGAEMEEIDESERRWGRSSDDVPLRALHRRWRELMASPERSGVS